MPVERICIMLHMHKTVYVVLNTGSFLPPVQSTYSGSGDQSSTGTMRTLLHKKPVDSKDCKHVQSTRV